MSTTGSLGVDKIFLEQAASLMRGGEVLPSLEELAKKLQWAAETRTPLKVKLGLDPTRPDLHLGHTVVLRKFRAFQDLGHEGILIIGDATALIGDPSGRNQTRPPLTEEEVKANAQTYLDQAGKIIDTRKAKIIHNSEWFKDFGLPDFLKLAAKVTVAQILVRDDFAKRYGENRPIFLHELFYPLMQGHDSVMIDADIELGGTDQRFNNLMGRELQLAEGKKYQQLVILMPLLEGTDGKIKMSKSYPEHCINLTDTPADIFGKMMSISDEMIMRYEQLLTPMTDEQLNEQQQMMKRPVDQGGLNPRDVKAVLSKWIVSQYYTMEEAEKAEQDFIARFRNHEIPEDMPEVKLPHSTPHSVVDLLVTHQLTPSRNEGRRLIQQGGVRLNGDKIEDMEASVTGAPGESHVLQAGKRKFLRLIFF